MVIDVSVHHNGLWVSPRYYTVDSMLLPSGNSFKCYEEVLYLQPMIPPRRFDIFSPDWGCSEGLDAFRFFFEVLVLLIISINRLGSPEQKWYRVVPGSTLVQAVYFGYTSTGHLYVYCTVSALPSQEVVQTKKQEQQATATVGRHSTNILDLSWTWCIVQDSTTSTVAQLQIRTSLPFSARSFEACS